MLQHDDFHLDTVLLRQVKQAARQAARDLEDEEEDVPVQRGTQRNQPADAEEEVDSMDVDEDQHEKIARAKSERQ